MEKYRDRNLRGREIYEISIEIDSWKENKEKVWERNRETDIQKMRNIEKRDSEINEKQRQDNKISTKKERKTEGVRERVNKTQQKKEQVEKKEFLWR